MSRLIEESKLPQLHPDFYSSIFCVGNGRHCTRGTLGEERFDAFRGVYQSGVYTRAPLGVMYYFAAPDWLPAFVRIDGELPETESSHRTLDMHSGLLTREAIFTHKDTFVKIVESRFASLDRPFLACQKLTVTVLSGKGKVDMCMGVDGNIYQSRAKYFSADRWPRCSEYGLKLAEIERQTIEGANRIKTILCSKQTMHRTIAIAEIEQTGGTPILPDTSIEDGLALISRRIPGGSLNEEFVLEKLSVIDHDLSKGRVPGNGADVRADSISSLDYDLCFSTHSRAMADFWDKADIEIDGDSRSQQSIRFALWGTRIAAPADEGFSSIAAKNLTGDWYRGAVFWDMDVFQLPLLVASAPELARNHVLYRALRLDPPRRLAAQEGFKGARYPGNQYETGAEDPPALGGMALMELHVTFDIGNGIMHYYQMTGDTAFMLDYGLEVIVETANFWSTRYTKEQDGRYHFRNACGPDQLHKPISDNAYTNISVVDYLERAEALIDQFRKLDETSVALMLRRCGIDEQDWERWNDVARNMYVPMVDKQVFEQFQDHSKLPIADPKATSGKEGSDGITKQADTVLLFETIPWRFSREVSEANYRYYAPRCTHTSSLSLCTHALVAARLGYSRDARKYFTWAAGVDLEDSMANTRHGHHGAALGGIWKTVVQGFGGLIVSAKGVELSPNLPPWWKSLKFRFFKDGIPVFVNVQPESLTVTNGGLKSVSLMVLGSPATIEPNNPLTVKYTPSWKEQPLDGVVFSLDSLLCGGKANCGNLLDGASPEMVDSAIPDLLKALGKAGVKRGLAATCENGKETAKQLGLSELFDVVIDNSILTLPLPAPQAFLTCTQWMEALPWNCVGIASRADSIEASSRAGIPTVAVGKKSEFSDCYVEEIADLSIDALHKIVEDADDTVNPYLEGNKAVMESEQKK